MCSDSLLLPYNLSSTVNFPTRIQNKSISTIANIFIDNTKVENYTMRPLSNGLSDHEAQLIEMRYIDMEPQNQQHQLIRKIENHSMADFVMKLSNEAWDTLADNKDTDTKFNSFLNTYLRIFHLSFPLKRIKNTTKHSTWMTMGIKTSCKHKRELYLSSRDSNVPRVNVTIKHTSGFCQMSFWKINEIIITTKC
jgi:hypothetical protein